jgi:hypothetical protein
VCLDDAPHHATRPREFDNLKKGWFLQGGELARIMAWIASRYYRYEIVAQELIRAMAGFPLWMYALWGLQQTGLFALPIHVVFPIGLAMSALQFSALVLVRKRTGWKLQVSRIRVMLVALLVPGISLVIWRVVHGDILRGVLFAIAIALVGVLIVRMKKRGVRW